MCKMYMIKRRGLSIGFVCKTLDFCVIKSKATYSEVPGGQVLTKERYVPPSERKCRKGDGPLEFDSICSFPASRIWRRINRLH